MKAICLNGTVVGEGRLLSCGGFLVGLHALIYQFVLSFHRDPHVYRRVQAQGMVFT
jgi:hypothetical protein